MSGWRLPAGGLVDRDRPIPFAWAGRRYVGLAGDTLASALLANGVDIVGRSFKYHRPRGLMAAGREEPNAIVQLETGAHSAPDRKATETGLYENLCAYPVNVWPSATWDLGAVASLFSRFLPAGFYYKTFLWPSWHWYEPLIRQAAGLGKAPRAPDPDHYAHRFDHVETLVVGSGAAGLAAALAAAQRGEQILLVEQDSVFGGGLLSDREPVGDMAPEAWRRQMLDALQAMDNVRMLARTQAFGLYDHGLVGLNERTDESLALQERRGPANRLWKVRCQNIVVATGAIERPAVFARNDLPGIMLASAAGTYALRYGVAPGREVIVVANNDSAWKTAFALHDAGVRIVAIADSRLEAPAAAEAGRRAIRVFLDAVPLEAFGRRRVRAIRLGGAGDGRVLATIACDTVLVSGGWNPAVHLHSQAGGTLAFDAALQAFLPDRSTDGVRSVGAAAGILDRDAAIAEARGIGDAPVSASAVGPTRWPAGKHARLSWLDYQNDVTLGDVALAASENFRSVEHLKRYTTLGMATDQGKTSNVAAIRAMASITGMAPGTIGTTRFRPPVDPVPIGAFAGTARGATLAPLAQLPSTRSALARAARLEPYGAWLRPACYPLAGESEAQAVAREVLTVRQQVGLFDASPLGKIEVKGPDAGRFLQRIYMNGVENLKPGRCRYGLMLDENGVILDDGVLARMSQDHFLVGTTSGNVSRIAAHLREWRDCEWPELAVLVDDVTTGWAVMTVAGPEARRVLQDLGTDIDLDPASFRHMCFRSGTLCGVEARIQRVSFSGELSFEVAVRWGHGRALFEALLDAGRSRGIGLFGVEALMAMRIEKGYLHLGSETDGTTLPQDIGFGAILAAQRDDHVGRRSTARPDALRGDRQQLVGLESPGDTALPVGAHIVMPGATESQGWVTSSIFSPTLERPIALAVVAGGRARLGETVETWDMGTRRKAVIVEPCFLDPEGRRLDG